jgi:hypothetical protein
MPRTKTQTKAQKLVKKLKKETRLTKITKTWKRQNLTNELDTLPATKTEQYKKSMWGELKNHTTYIIYKDGVEHTRLTVASNDRSKHLDTQ